MEKIKAMQKDAGISRQKSGFHDFVAGCVLQIEHGKSDHKWDVAG
jgi:hypothetical protein